MAAKEKKGKRPSLMVILGLGLLTVLLGAFLGTISLLSQTVTEVSEMPSVEKRDSGAVYYVKGRESGSSLWKSKRNQLIRGTPGAIMLGENELNQWARDVFKVKTPQKGEEPKKSTLFGLEVNRATPNFRILETGIQLSVALEFPRLSDSRKFIYQVNGQMVASEDGWKFVPESGFLGKAPLGSVPVVSDALYQGVLALFQETPEWDALTEGWSKVSDVRFEADRMILTIE